MEDGETKGPGGQIETGLSEDSAEQKPKSYIAVGFVHGNNKRVFKPGEIIDCLDGIDLNARLADSLIKEIIPEN